MGQRALIIGGSGQIGQACASALLAAGWSVTAGQKRPERFPAELIAAGARAIHLDRSDDDSLARAVGGGFDALIDTVAFDDGHARQLLAIQADVGAFVVISSGSVYRDDAGRTLDEARETGFPRFPIPIPETQPTVAPGQATYSTRKVALERTLLNEATRPVTILRPFAIHGPGSLHPREWWFVKRILDGRRRAPLAHGGESIFHTSAVANIAELARVALEGAAPRVLNAADPQALTVAAIGRIIAKVYGVELDLVPIEGPPAKGVGATPWSGPYPIVADMSRAEAAGYRPVTTYEDAIGAACRSAVAMAAAGEQFVAYLSAMFDYEAEDRFFAAQALRK